MAKAIPKVTAENYFDPDLRMPYMSVSQYKDFAGHKGCEARALATVRGTWTPDRNTTFTVGHYVEMDITSDPDFPAFCKEHADEIYKEPTLKEIAAAFPDVPIKGFKKADIIAAHPEVMAAGSKTSEFVVADRMVSRLRNSPEAMMFIGGAHVQTQVLLVGEVEGVLWKGLADFITPSRKEITDLKTAKDFSDTWIKKMVEGEPRNVLVEWFEEWQYPFQLWVYGRLACMEYGWDENEIVRNILGVTKQKPSGCRGFPFFNARRLNLYAEKMLVALPRVQAIKRGDIQPTYCLRNKCDYCREFEPFQFVEADVEI